MSHKIAEIVFDPPLEGYSFGGNASGKSRLNGLSKFNFIVGPNNSGKSRVLRGIFLRTPLKFVPPHASKGFFNWCTELKRKIDKVDSTHQTIDVIGAIARSLQELLNQCFIQEKTDNVPELFNEIGLLYGKITQESNRMRSQFYGNEELEAFIELLRDAGREIENSFSELKDPIKFRRLYIPILRGLRPINTDVDLDIYRKRTDEDYFQGRGSSDAETFTGLSMCREVRKLLLGNHAERKKIREFEDFISRSFFDGKSVALIPKNGELLDVKIGNEMERSIHHLGDGLQTILVLTFPVFLEKDSNLLAFIEEPELNLHPGMQRLLMNVLSRFENHQYFISTHSNHLLEIALDYSDVSVFVSRKKLDDSEGEEKVPTFEIENVSNSDRRTLELLGVRNSSVLLSNSTVWVEGITDRRYLAHYLHLYQNDTTIHGHPTPRHFQEDLHYSFVEYGGSNITHWSFLDEGDCDKKINADWLCGRLFLVADRDDKASEAKRNRHERLEKALGERFYLLNCREIENLLEPGVLKSILIEYGENGAGLKEVHRVDYNDKPLGTFIEEDLLGGKRKRKRSYAETSGTITDKTGFCQKAIDVLKDWNQLSAEAKDLTEKIYKFIADNNPA